VLPADLGTRMKGVEYWATNQADDDLRDAVEHGINDELRRREYQKGGLSADEVQRIAKLEVKVDSKDPKKEAGKEGVDEMEKLRQFAPVGFVYLLFVALMTVAQMLLNNCVEEKSNRIVEVLLSSVTPMELMFGKLVGIAAIGVHDARVVAPGRAAGRVSATTDGGGKVFDFVFNVLLTPQLLGSFLVYFALGTCSTRASSWPSAACATRSRTRRTSWARS
jgi:ABC-2 type transport system permease protein